MTKRACALLPLAVVGLTVVTGCVDETIVYENQDLFKDPADVARSFLGYVDHDSKLTACGNCHIEKQAVWEGTAHAGAWAGLQSSDAAETVCEGCHTVGELGNTVAEIAGHNATGDARYEDVQCESCHGPGLVHVLNPTDGTVPLALLDVGVAGTFGCGECHSGAHRPFVDEWNASRHGEGANAPIVRNWEGCPPCHEGKGALEAFGVNTSYLELTDPDATMGVTCAVCHDPHSTGIEHQLRFPVDSRDTDTNLCMKCHQNQAVPDPGSSRGPHSPQGPLLLGVVGTVGWTPPNFQYNVDDLVAGTHGSVANEDLCVTCHMNSFTVPDPASSEDLYNGTGHSFDAIPCVDAQGLPSGDDTCAITTAARTFSACADGACHGSEDAALAAYESATTRISDLTGELQALLALVPPSEFDTRNPVTVAEGADFNAELGEIVSSAIHNPSLTEALLTGSIQAVMDTYGVPLLSPHLNLSNIIFNPSRQGN